MRRWLAVPIVLSAQLFVACGDEAAPVECTCSEGSCGATETCAVVLDWPESCFVDGETWSVGLESGAGTTLDGSSASATACTGVEFEQAATVTVDSPPPGWPDAVTATCFTRGAEAELGVCSVAFTVSPACAGGVESWDISIDGDPVGAARIDAPLEPCLFVAEGESRAFSARGGGLVSSGTVSGCGASGGRLAVTLSCQ